MIHDFFKEGSVFKGIGKILVLAWIWKCSLEWKTEKWDHRLFADENLHAPFPTAYIPELLPLNQHLGFVHIHPFPSDLRDMALPA